MKKSFMKWFLPLCMLLMMVGCKECVPPTVTTTPASGVTQTTAMSGGEVTEEGGSPVTERGVCWNTAPYPTTSNNKTSNGTGLGSYTSSLTSLTAATTYYVRAYATNSEGTNYGEEVTFSTLPNFSTITTTAVTAITTSSATSGGTISADGGGAITARGVCWNTTTNPTISNSKTSDGTGIGSFVSSISGLSPGVKYYVKAYATNSAGTSYGNELSFTTSLNLPTVTTTTATSITATTATSGGNVTADGGGAVTAKGVCWSTSTGPTISNTKTSDGTGTGIFNSSLTSLAANTTYYLKAYATNSAGTSYGNEVIFKTLGNLPTVTTSNVSSIGTTTATSGGIVTSDGGSAVTARGICWSTSSNPTTANNKTTDGIGIGSFSSSLTSLIAVNRYYVRAYATNIAGTAYGNEITFQTLPPSGTVSDIEGNVYKWVAIGTQIWMAENLKTTKYKDGTNIPLVTDNWTWDALTTPGYCWHNNDISNKIVYGALYNWYAANTGKLCPDGWHVPTESNWQVLIDLLGGATVAGGKLKEIGTSHWKSPNTGATNEVGFNGLPAGGRDNGGVFNLMSEWAIWWSDTEYAGGGYGRVLTYDKIIVGGGTGRKQGACSIRCLKD